MLPTVRDITLPKVPHVPGKTLPPPLNSDQVCRVAEGDYFGDILEEKHGKNFKFAAQKGTSTLPAFSLLGMALRSVFLYLCVSSAILLFFSPLASPPPSSSPIIS